jgi:hypothetical protein
MSDEYGKDSLRVDVDVGTVVDFDADATEDMFITCDVN